MLRIVISLEPITKKNSQQIIVNRATGRPQIIPSKKYRQYEKDCAPFIKGKGLAINEPVTVQCVYYMKTKRRVDLTNLLNATMDILCFYDVILDDNRDIVYSVDGSRVFYSKENPRTEVTITPIKESFEKWAKK